MAEPHVVNALVAKRAEMAGLIALHQKQISRLTVDLSHVDATLKLFAPEMDLRTAGTPESIPELAAALAARLGLTLEEEELRKFEKTI